MNTVRPEVTGRALVEGQASGPTPLPPARGPPMTLQEFIQNFGLPPIVSIKQSCEVLGCGHSKLYELRKSKKLRIVPRAGGTGVPVEDHYQLYLKAVST